ncbi:MAG: SH3 domain-containing protein, partial [Rhodobacteraceae bacterium]|nr:SH3 domain-containing protein [Paracoccaceae bacterium]
MKQIIAGSMIAVLTVTTALAGPAQTTANVNFRTGPGSSNSSLGVLQAGTDVDLINCDDSGSWCAIEVDGQSGFVSGKYLVSSGEDEDSTSRWPRAFGLSGESFVVLYEPQFSSWEDFRTLDALVAAEYRDSEDADPYFGVIGLRMDTARDTNNGTVVLSNVEVTQLDFGALGRDQVSELSTGVGEILPTNPLTVSEVRIVASLASYQQVNDVEGLKADPPVIFHSTTPARLLQTDGEATFAPVKGAVGVEFVVNTNWDMFRIDDMLWLRDATSWLTAPNMDGPWEMTMDMPDALSALPGDGNWDDARAAIPAVAYDNGAPHIFYTNEVAELISFRGEPEFEDVPGGDLQWVSNTESDLFKMKTSSTYYYLISGRWFSSDSLDGPWVFATPDLPDEFLNIPDDVPYYTVRASVPGSSEANEARLRASIPELAFVNPDEITPPEISYDGEPAFETIEGTKMSYAVNTEAQVIQVEDKYFLVYDGIWFVSDTPEGPWIAASEIPDTIYDIPPSSPVYNTTYVRVYDSSPTQIVY